jgi:predicted Ser/Thr protein kinase
MSIQSVCPACGASTAAASGVCAVCGHRPGDGAPPVAAALASESRLSDSGARELHNLLVEATHGDYQILQEVGRGGMAVVYRATEIHLARTVAIKVLPPELTFARGATERFRREARTAAALDHPGIIPIYRISSQGKLFWYTMRYLEGRSLAELLHEKGRLGVSEAAAILDQVASALDYAHQRGVVHRDIKPGNVMLEAQGRVIVTDFGIAKELSGSGLTGSGAILGTPYYMSPEQCRGGELTGAADQYSLGVMTFQVLSGHLPFEADSAIDVIHKHVTEAPPPLDSVVPGLPRHVTEAVGRALAKKPGDRFPTVVAFANALRQAPSDETLIMSRRAVRESGAVPDLLPWPRRRTAIVAAVALVAAGVVAVLPRWRQGDAPALPASEQAVPGPAVGEPGPAAATGAATPEGTAAAGGESATTPQGGSTAPAMGFVRLRVANTWADIAIAGQTLEQRRVWADSLPPGNYTVSFTREGYTTVERRITVRAGQVSSLSVTIEPREPVP